MPLFVGKAQNMCWRHRYLAADHGRLGDPGPPEERYRVLPQSRRRGAKSCAIRTCSGSQKTEIIAAPFPTSLVRRPTKDKGSRGVETRPTGAGPSGAITHSRLVCVGVTRSAASGRGRAWVTPIRRCSAVTSHQTWSVHWGCSAPFSTAQTLMRLDLGSTCEATDSPPARAASLRRVRRRTRSAGACGPVGGRQRPVWPSICSRMMSAWPAWRAVS